MKNIIVELLVEFIVDGWIIGLIEMKEECNYYFVWIL